MAFEVAYKVGRGWSFCGIYHEVDANKAARKASYVHGRKIIKVRPEGSRDKWLVYRFKYVNTLTSC